MISLVKLALDKGNGKKHNVSSKKAKKSDDVSPFKDAVKEAWDAMKKDDFEGFSEAFGNAVKIRSSDTADSDED